jgi:large subunit ribosomal protein L32
MAVPKQKTSKQRKRTRAANWKASAPALTECPQCHAQKLSHRICECGYYKNKKLVEEKPKKAE